MFNQNDLVLTKIQVVSVIEKWMINVGMPRRWKIINDNLGKKTHNIDSQKVESCPGKS
jgi:hypothetical protein